MNISRRKSNVVNVGNVQVGGNNPIRIQSMLNTSTNDTEACVKQAIEVIEAGGEIVRLTTQGVKEAINMTNIEDGLKAAGCNVPLVADVHFNPKVADEAALRVEKVRINPGNYANSYEEIRAKFIPFLESCKEHKTAIRIGVNHGSLNKRMMEKYGDTPEGMTESCMEFLRICKEVDFKDVVISVKASNVRIMVYTVRQLARRMEEEGMAYPLHLGVTEAGDGEDGRVKSAVGIGTLLSDGIGDTIRVSLSEPPAAEIPVARMIVDVVDSRMKNNHFTSKSESYIRRSTTPIGEFGGNQVPVVLKADDALPNGVQEIDVCDAWKPLDNSLPVVFSHKYDTNDVLRLQIEASIDFGHLFIDGLGDGIRIIAPNVPQNQVESLAYGILQAARARMSKTEYISCPSCGRTLFDIQSTIARIKAATSHLKKLKIGVMGCIVNGPGEMADADYGYVGAGPDRVSLYKAQTCMAKNIPASEAVDRLVQLIKDSGDWEEM